MINKFLFAFAMTAVAAGAQASVIGGVANQNPSSFISLSSSADVSVVGGELYPANTNGLPNAAIPMNGAPDQKLTQGVWLGVGPGNGSGGDAVVSFVDPTSFVSFLWGSPDDYNKLVVTTNLGSYTFQSSNLLGLVYEGNQDFASYVGFTAIGESIESLTFSSSSNAFEASNFSVTTPVPEPESYALLLGGLGVVGFMVRRRRQA
jgi:hypothetical protein